jgi:hypothetical protein
MRLALARRVRCSKWSMTISFVFGEPRLTGDKPEDHGPVTIPTLAE